MTYRHTKYMCSCQICLTACQQELIEHWSIEQHADMSWQNLANDMRTNDRQELYGGEPISICFIVGWLQALMHRVWSSRHGAMLRSNKHVMFTKQKPCNLNIMKSMTTNLIHKSQNLCTCSISHNAPFRTEMCTFLFWMEHCGIWNIQCAFWDLWNCSINEEVLIYN